MAPPKPTDLPPTPQLPPEPDLPPAKPVFALIFPPFLSHRYFREGVKRLPIVIMITATVLILIWVTTLSNYAVILTLNVGEVTEKQIGVNFNIATRLPWPPRPDDPQFFNSSRIPDIGTINSFKLECGIVGEPAWTPSTVVFWSEDNWEGTKLQFNCGSDSQVSAQGAYFVASNIPQFTSFCVESQFLGIGQRINRCISGPSCTDGMKDGDETDKDCGGSCGKCTTGDTCIVSNDCANGLTCRFGKCRPAPAQQPPQAAQPSPALTCNDSSANASTYSVYPVLTNDSNGCADYRVPAPNPNANSLSESKACLEDAGYSVIGSACRFDVRIESNPTITTEVWAGSTEDAVTCACASWNLSNCDSLVANLATDCDACCINPNQ